MSGPRIGGLFEGYGGLTAGVVDVFGGSLAWYSEVDKGALKILGHRFPDVPNVGDVTTVDWSQVEPVDILTGGSPCQDLSHAGKRQGMTEGTRSNLWVAMREAIAQLRPAVVVWENVRGAYSAGADSDLEQCPGCVGNLRGRPALRALARVLGDLADLGYDCRWHGLRAADVGAPHGRFRVFVVATDIRHVGHEWPGRARDGRAGSTDSCVEDGLTLLGTPRASEWKGCGPVGSKSHTHRLERDYLDAQILAIEAQRLLPTPRVTTGGSIASQKRVREVLDGEVLETADCRLELTAEVLAHRGEQWGDYAAAVARWERILGRPAPAPTMTSAKGNPQLSPAFVEWLMGLPAGWVTDVPGITRNEALKALGNGVVPQQAAAAIRTMLAWEAVSPAQHQEAAS